MLEAVDGCYECAALHGLVKVVWSHTVELLSGFSESDSVLLQSTPVWCLHPVVEGLRLVLRTAASRS